MNQFFYEALRAGMENLQASYLEYSSYLPETEEQLANASWSYTAKVRAIESAYAEIKALYGNSAPELQTAEEIVSAALAHADKTGEPIYAVQVLGTAERYTPQYVAEIMRHVELLR